MKQLLLFTTVMTLIVAISAFVESNAFREYETALTHGLHKRSLWENPHTRLVKRQSRTDDDDEDGDDENSDNERCDKFKLKEVIGEHQQCYEVNHGYQILMNQTAQL